VISGGREVVDNPMVCEILPIYKDIVDKDTLNNIDWMHRFEKRCS